jgi:hypothetical protein
VRILAKLFPEYPVPTRSVYLSHLPPDSISILKL